MRPEIRLPIRDLADSIHLYQPRYHPAPPDIGHLKVVGYSQDQDAVNMPAGFYRRADLEGLVVRLRELSDL